MDLEALRELAIAKPIGITHAALHVDTPPSLVDAWINEGKNKLHRSGTTKWHDGEATLSVDTAGAVTGVPADFLVPLMVRNETAPHPFELSYHDGGQRFLPQENARFSQQVQLYSYHAGSFEVWPTPAVVTTLTLRYFKSWPDLVNDTDTPVFPSIWHDLLSTYAASKLALRMGKTGQAQAESLFAEWTDGVRAFLTSPLNMRSADMTFQEAFAHSLWAGQGVDW